MGKIRTWLAGYVQVYVSGNRPERFLSLLHHKEIPVWRLEPYADGYRFELARKYVRSLPAIRRKTGSRVEFRKRSGLPYWLFRYRKRKLFVLGVFLAAGLVWFCSRFIWDIHVEGTYYYTDEQIEARIREQYVALGQRKSEIDCNTLEERLREDFPELSWVSCEIVGTQLNVSIKETLEGTETVDEETPPQDIAAAKDGVIVEMITRSGTPMAKVGQTVSRDEVLISGVVYIYDDYDEVLETDYVAADGDVIAETTYTYEDSFDMQYYEKTYTGRSQSAVILEAVNRTWEFHLPWRTFPNYDTIEETHQLRLGHTYALPFALIVSERREYTPTLVTYSEEEARTRAEERLQRYVDNLSEKEVEIMENHVTIEIKDGVCHAEGDLVVWERIGYGRSLNIPEETE